MCEDPSAARTTCPRPCPDEPHPAAVMNATRWLPPQASRFLSVLSFISRSCMTKELLDTIRRNTILIHSIRHNSRSPLGSARPSIPRSINMRSLHKSVRGWTWSLGAVALLVASGCAQQPAAPVATVGTAKKLPVIDLDEKPAFPLPKHLESKDIAAGSIPHAELFEDGAKLFHTPLNGLDGIGMKRTVGGAPVNRFSTGPAGGGQPLQVGSQSCGACHSQPS